MKYKYQKIIIKSRSTTTNTNITTTKGYPTGNTQRGLSAKARRECSILQLYLKGTNAEFRHQHY